MVKDFDFEVGDKVVLNKEFRDKTTRYVLEILKHPYLTVKSVTEYGFNSIEIEEEFGQEFFHPVDNNPTWVELDIQYKKLFIKRVTSMLYMHKQFETDLITLIQKHENS